jgi:saccharopine dehydrogenase-like NADP-dependent oxidoreductase
MKIFALGAYGKVGLSAVKLLAQSDVVDKIAIAGRDKERAEITASEIGKKAIAVNIDATDEEKLTSQLKGYDIVMNAALDEAVLPSMRAAIRSGTHYCDAAEVNEKALRLDTEAKASGITSIIGNGIGPGVTNLMAVQMARQLEEVEQLQLGFAALFNWENGRDLTPKQWTKDPKESLAALHEIRWLISWLFEMMRNSGVRTVLNYQDGQWVEVNPLKEGLEVPLTQGGSITSYPYASNEPLWGTLPVDLSTLQPVEVFFCPLPPQLHDLLREQALHVVEEKIETETAVDYFYGAVESDPHRWLVAPEDFVPTPVVWVRAVGHKEGRAARANSWFTAPMWDVGGYFITSVALAVAVLKILRGEIEERGVRTAEKAFDPLPFLNEVASLLTDFLPDGKMLEENFEWME